MLRIMKINSNLLIVGILLLTFGYAIMAANVFGSNEKLAAFVKLSASPIIVIAGYFFIGLSIFQVKHGSAKK